MVSYHRDYLKIRRILQNFVMSYNNDYTSVNHDRKRFPSAVPGSCTTASASLSHRFVVLLQIPLTVHAECKICFLFFSLTGSTYLDTNFSSSRSPRRVKTCLQAKHLPFFIKLKKLIGIAGHLLTKSPIMVPNFITLRL